MNELKFLIKSKTLILFLFLLLNIAANDIEAIITIIFQAKATTVTQHPVFIAPLPDEGTVLQTKPISAFDFNYLFLNPRQSMSRPHR